MNPNETTPPENPESKQNNYQLKLSDQEMNRLAVQVNSDYRAAIGDHNRRIKRWREYYRRWRALPDLPQVGEEEKSNFNVPLIRWNVLNRLAKEADSVLGNKAQVIADPVGPSDQRKVRKVAAYCTWLVFSYMKLVKPMIQFMLWKILFGRSVAYSPWKRVEFEIDGQEVVDYEGPDFVPLWPDDFIVPAEEVESLHDFSFVIRRYRVTPDELLKGEEDGRYQGIEENFEQLVTQAKRGMKREFEGEEIKQAADEAEGIFYQGPLSSGEYLTVLEWYGKWRMLKGKQDGAETDFKVREMKQTELVIRFIPDLNQIISVQSLEELYPGMRKRRPFVESALLPEGRYWGIGMCEMLADAEDELKANHNMATDAIELGVMPPLAVRPASGMDTDKKRWEPGERIATDNPALDCKQIEIHPNIEAIQWKEQTVLAYVERVTAQSDMAMGRASDRANAPRTARQTVALLQEGNIAQSLYTRVLAEDMSDVLAHFWELEYWFAPDRRFFRVSESDADGLFDVKDGGSWLEQEERDGRYDFSLKFADSYWSREAAAERTLQRYQLDLQNPLIAQNPRALWEITNQVHDALGDSNFSSIVPMPPEPDLPVDPKEEWNRLLQGEDITVNPQDNDELHLMRHTKDLQAAVNEQDAEGDAIRKMKLHYLQHVEQLQQKKMQQALMEQAVAAVQRLGPAAMLGGGGGAPGQQQPQGPPAVGAPDASAQA